jgi:ArsR family transcriptional regulator
MATSSQTESGFEDPIYRSAVDAACLLSAAAEPNRMAILTTLAGGPACVCLIQEHVPVAPNLLSYHLRVLRDAGLVVSHRRGRWVDYELVEDALARLRGAIPLPAAEGIGRGAAHTCASTGTSTGDPLPGNTSHRST